MSLIRNMRRSFCYNLFAGRFLLGAVIAFSFAGGVGAQSGVYDPTFGQGNPGASPGSAQTGAPYSQGAASQSGYGMYGQPVLGPTSGAGYNPTTITDASQGYGQATGAGGPTPYSNTQAQQGLAPTVDNAPSIMVNPTSAGAIGRPLYARPSLTVPGQFELYTRRPPEPGEFEKFILKALGRPLPLFGESLILNGNRGFATPATTTVPPDYRLNPGDELIVGVTGSVEADLHLTIDSEGKVFIPKIGAVQIAGIRYGDLQGALARQFSTQYKQARISVVISRLHGITVYVTGFAQTPGSYTLSSLSTLVDAVLAAGGPSSGGSFRTVELRRDGRLVTTLDLYDLLIKGDTSHDAILQNMDVINVAPVGPEVAVTGSVNNQAIYEARPGDTLTQVLAYAGGLNSLADRSRIVVARLSDLDRTGSAELNLAQASITPAEGGEVVRVLSLGDIARPRERQAVLVTIDGEVDHPGRYYLPPGSTMADLLRHAGGFTPGAFIYGTFLRRDSVQQQEKVSLKQVYNDLEMSAAVAPLEAVTSGVASAVPGGASALGTVVQQSLVQFIQDLKQNEPDGRVILNVNYSRPVIPDSLALEDNDKVTIPPEPTTIGVFGAVFQPGAFAVGAARSIGDYVKLSGGPQRYADRGEIFVVHANGALASTKQDHDLARRTALPGDVIFVPVRSSPDLLARIAAIGTLVSQIGVGLATIGIVVATL